MNAQSTIKSSGQFTNQVWHSQILRSAHLPTYSLHGAESFLRS